MKKSSIYDTDRGTVYDECNIIRSMYLSQPSARPIPDVCEHRPLCQDEDRGHLERVVVGVQSVAQPGA